MPLNQQGERTMQNTLEKLSTPWETFTPGNWMENIDVVDFIQKDYTPYEGSDEFLTGTTQRTERIWAKVKDLMKQEHDNNGLLDADTSTPSAIDAFEAGYIDKDDDFIYSWCLIANNYCADPSCTDFKFKVSLPRF